MSMVSGSLSILSSASSFPSSSTRDLSNPSIPSIPRSCKRSTRSPGCPHSSSPLILRIKASAGGQRVEDGSTEQFLRKNCITDFMRFKQGNDGGTGDLQTAVVTYKKKFPWSLLQPFLQVDLVSTIHIADKEYFETIQKELEPFDCVLYEMVASRETLEKRRNPAVKKSAKDSRSRSFNILGFIQRLMARALVLDFQLDCIDYQAENWYHADLDYETFKLLQREKGEFYFTFARDMTLKSTKAMAQPIPIPEDLGPVRSKLLWASRSLPMPLVGLLIIGSVCADAENSESGYPELEALSRLDVGAAMKLFLAKRLTSEFSLVTADVEEGSVIIGERNRAASLELRRAMDKGHSRIAILYGGGHMPDLGRRLQEEFDLTPSRVRWITAWSIRNQDLKSNSLPFFKTMADVSGWPLNQYQTLALFILSLVLALDLWLWELFFGTAMNWVSEIASEVAHLVDKAQVM
ncbi:uncharacterized protein LOC131158084 [Malania oleifera]|uniref:uncharacterized protein LOC131158084 n=1 Tax=Malania oleifera TaxID=397392 RepID=UPI0025AE9BAC|nr:uncharacterized protein LOC131158084 [Malania oleifera]